MALEIIWSEEADNNLARIISYLQKNWTEKELRKFSQTLNEKLNLITRRKNALQSNDKIHSQIRLHIIMRLTSARIADCLR